MKHHGRDAKFGKDYNAESPQVRRLIPLCDQLPLLRLGDYITILFKVQFYRVLQNVDHSSFWSHWHFGEALT